MENNFFGRDLRQYADVLKQLSEQFGVPIWAVLIFAEGFFEFIKYLESSIPLKDVREGLRIIDDLSDSEEEDFKEEEDCKEEEKKFLVMSEILSMVLPEAITEIPKHIINKFSCGQTPESPPESPKAQPQTQPKTNHPKPKKYRKRKNSKRNRNK